MEQYHALEIKKVLETLQVDDNGLTNKQAVERIEQYGVNVLPEKRKRSLIVLFLRQFNSWFIYILIIAAGVSFFFDKKLDAYIIVAIIVLNAAIGFGLETRAEKAIAALKSLIRSRAKALRDNVWDLIDASDVVPGDIISLEAGDRVPADARVISARDFNTQESSLTGESFTINKNAGILPEKTTLAERSNMIWMGTLVTSGTGKAVVVGTGSNTAIGKIAVSLKDTKSQKTHFKHKTDRLALVLGAGAIVAAMLTFGVGVFWLKLSLVEVFIFSVASLVSSIPEGLPAVLAVVLAVGAYRMAQKKAIVRHLPVIEDLSVATVILTDKTGTLTQNTMTVRKIMMSDQEIDVSGEGWKPKGTFFYKNEIINPLNHLVLRKLTQIAVVTNNSAMHKEGDDYEVLGDPTEAALLVLGRKAGLDKDEKAQNTKVLDQVPFSQDTRSQAVLIADPDPELFIVGAEDTLVPLSSHYLTESGIKRLTQKQKQLYAKQVAELTSRAMRVVALAYRTVPKKTKNINSDFYKNLTLVGFVGIADPIRPEAAKAIADAKRAGIRVIMATGDHGQTALAIARQIGLMEKDATLSHVYTGSQLEGIAAKDFKKIIHKSSVYARMTPDLKLKVIQTLQNDGKVVAMIGDGVNDAPALKIANVGIAMGTIGTDVAREAADIVLSDDNFASLIRAIEQGRLIFNNIRQTSFFMITTNIAEIVTILGGLLLGSTLPLTAIQILWINLITDGIPNLALAGERSHEDLLNRPPNKRSEHILSRELIPFMLIIVGLMSTVTLVFFLHNLQFGLAKAQTVTFALLVFFQLFNALNLRSLRQSLFKIGLLTNKVMVIALLASFTLQIVIMTNPFMRELFGLAKLSIGEIGLLILASLSAILCIELYKYYSKARQKLKHTVVTMP